MEATAKSNGTLLIHYYKCINQCFFAMVSEAEEHNHMYSSWQDELEDVCPYRQDDKTGLVRNRIGF